MSVHGGEIFTEEELKVFSERLQEMRYIAKLIAGYIKNYKPEHTCPQCSEPKKEKDPPIVFHLTDS